jgi:hypothetical protein
VSTAYLLRVWAGDGDLDTFRTEICREDEPGNETVVHDTGFDQPLLNGSIMIPTAKAVF